MHSQRIKLNDDSELSILLAFIENSCILRFCSGGGDYANPQNDFGDPYLEIDIQCELNINTQLKKTVIPQVKKQRKQSFYMKVENKQLPLIP
ncbi:unnamed protein product [Paramecium primaurelia]|uniref:Uncharacterized protein n=1 Tax=Paramecium primaurelia TaxID=5886 RepID=A0A8S1LJM8_PARPR|nr:unnamed protein product [Paramecium primaurelia]